jgi:hypothetical protein
MASSHVHRSVTGSSSYEWLRDGEPIEGTDAFVFQLSVTPEALRDSNYFGSDACRCDLVRKPRHRRVVGPRCSLAADTDVIAPRYGAAELPSLKFRRVPSAKGASGDAHSTAQTHR